MSEFDIYLTYIGMPLSVVIIVILFSYRMKGGFTSFIGRYIYVFAGLISATIFGLVMYINEDNTLIFTCSVAVILFVVFIYNAPMRNSEFKN